MNQNNLLIVSDEELKTLAAGLYTLGQLTLGPSKFFNDFVSLYEGVYEEDGKEILLKIREILPPEVDYNVFFSLLFRISRSLDCPREEK